MKEILMDPKTAIEASLHQRSVKFNFKDEVEIPILPLEKENIQQSKIMPVETSEKDNEERDTIEEKIPLTVRQRKTDLKRI